MTLAITFLITIAYYVINSIGGSRYIICRKAPKTKSISIILL